MKTFGDLQEGDVIIIYDLVKIVARKITAITKDGPKTRMIHFEGQRWPFRANKCFSIQDSVIIYFSCKDAAEEYLLQRIMNSDYWYFNSYNNSYQSKNGGLVYLDYHITMVSTSNFVENKRLKYDKIKELLTNKINYLNEKNSQFTSMLENLDWILHKLTKFNDEAKEIFSSIPYGVVDDIVDIKSLGEKWFIKITE